VTAEHHGSAKSLRERGNYMDIGKVATTIAAIIGVPAALVGFWFLVSPNSAPWTSLRVDISETSIEHNATVEDFSQRAYLNPERPEEAAHLTVIETPPSYEPEMIGNVVSYRLEMEGFARRTVRVYWSVYEETGQRVDDDDLNDQLGWPSNNFEAKRRINVVSGDAFVPLPEADGIYFVEIGVWDGEGVRMDIVDSPKFEVVDGRSREVPPDSETAE
jgi:hypothetical protein